MQRHDHKPNPPKESTWTLWKFVLDLYYVSTILLFTCSWFVRWWCSFGSLVVSESTGLILNNHMADFAKSEGPVLDTQKVQTNTFLLISINCHVAHISNDSTLYLSTFLLHLSRCRYNVYMTRVRGPRSLTPVWHSRPRTLITRLQWNPILLHSLFSSLVADFYSKGNVDFDNCRLEFVSDLPNYIVRGMCLIITCCLVL